MKEERLLSRRAGSRGAVVQVCEVTLRGEEGSVQACEYAVQVHGRRRAVGRRTASWPGVFAMGSGRSGNQFFDQFCADTCVISGMRTWVVGCAISFPLPVKHGQSL